MLKFNGYSEDGKLNNPIWNSMRRACFKNPNERRIAIQTYKCVANSCGSALVSERHKKRLNAMLVHMTSAAKGNAP